MGDAAHSLLNVTHLGTGLALEDCLVLDQLLQQSLTSTESDENSVAKRIADALTLFSSQRVPEMAAAANLCFDVSKTNMYVHTTISPLQSAHVLGLLLKCKF